jgi:mannose-6-phosphate isomerase-like protein (cupin superfamily)
MKLLLVCSEHHGYAEIRHENGMDDELIDLRWQAINNSYFRQAILNGQRMQIVLMSLRKREESGPEAHEDCEHVYINVFGQGRIVIDGEESQFSEQDCVLVRPGAEHSIINTGDQPLKMIVMYSPPHYAAVNKRKPRKKPKPTSL